MVSGRYKLADDAKSVKPADSMSKDTSMDSYKTINIILSIPAKFNKKGVLDMEGLPSAKKKDLDEMARDAEKGFMTATEFHYYDGKKVWPVELKSKTYIGLAKTKKTGARETTVYNPANKHIEIIQFTISKKVLEQEEA